MANTKDKSGSSDRSGKGKAKDSNEKNGRKGSSHAKPKQQEDDSGNYSNPRKRYICSTCGNSYAKDGDLQEHIQDAHQAPCHPCDQCRQKFKRPAELKRHKAAVHSPRQMPSPVDDREPSGKRSLFSITRQLKQQSQEGSSDSHRRDYMCGVCGLPFSKRENLQNHFRTIHKK